MSLKEHAIQSLCRSRPGYNEKRVLAWHFLRSGKLSLHSNAVRPRLLNGDQAPVKVSRRIYQLQGSDITACWNGLHASEKIMDAAKYCRTDWICRVEVWGDLDHHPRKKPNKICGRYRRVLWIMMATDIFTQMAWDIGLKRLKKKKPTKKMQPFVDKVLAMEKRGSYLKKRSRAKMRDILPHWPLATERDNKVRSILFSMLYENGMSCLENTLANAALDPEILGYRQWVNRELPKRLEAAR